MNRNLSAAAASLAALLFGCSSAERVGPEHEVRYSLQTSALMLPSSIDRAAEAASVLTLSIADTGADGFPSRLHGIGFRVGAANGIPNLATALGHVALFMDDVHLADGNIAKDYLSFPDVDVQVREGGTITLDLRICWSHKAGALSGLDGNNLVLRLAPEDLIVSAGSQVSPAQKKLDSDSTGIALHIEATQLTVATQPKRRFWTGENMGPIAFLAVDDNGNIDHDFREPALLSLEGEGELISNDDGELVQYFSRGQATWQTIYTDIPGTIRLVISTTPSNFTTRTSEIYVDQAMPDLRYHATGTVRSLPSMVDEQSEMLPVFGLRFEDGGDDGLPARVTGLTFRPTADSQLLDLQRAVGGIHLYSGDTLLAEGRIEPAAIVFTDLGLEIENASATTIDLHMFWSSSPDALDGLDNLSLELGLSATDIQLARGSTVAAAHPTVQSGDRNITLEIAASQISVTRQPLDTVFVGRNLGPLSIEATDANGNTDEDFSQRTTLRVQGGQGRIESADLGGIAKTFDAGNVGWANLSIDSAGVFTIRAATEPSGLVADTRTVIVNPPLTEVGYRLDYAAPSLSSASNSPRVAPEALRFTFKDAGGDRLPSVLSGIVLRPATGNEIPNLETAIGGAILIANGSYAGSAVIGPDSIAFSGFAIEIAESGSASLSVHVYWSDADDALDGLDNAHLVVGLDPSDVTIARGSAIALAQGLVASRGIDLRCDIRAVQLGITGQPASPVYVTRNMGPVAFEATISAGDER